MGGNQLQILGIELSKFTKTTQKQGYKQALSFNIKLVLRINIYSYVKATLAKKMTFPKRYPLISFNDRVFSLTKE